jgi:GTP1/Obg family GTP-binding protein
VTAYQIGVVNGMKPFYNEKVIIVVHREKMNGPLDKIEWISSAFGNVSYHHSNSDDAFIAQWSQI